MNQLLLSGALMLATSLSAASSRTWTPEEMMKVVSVIDAQCSPDGTQGAYTTVDSIMTDERSDYLNRGWIGNQPVMQNAFSRMVRWSPDGTSVAFLVKENGIENLYVLPLNGSPRKITSGSTSIQSYRWSPDSQAIAFARKDSISLGEQAAEKRKEDYYLFEDKKRGNSLWVVNVSTTDEKRLTEPPYYVRGGGDFGSCLEDFDWSPDSKEITFGYSPAPEYDYYYMNCALAAVNLQTGAIRKFPQKTDHESVPRYSPDGETIAFMQSDQPSTYAMTRHVAVMSKDGSNRRQLALTPQEAPNIVGPSVLGWTADGKNVLFFEPLGTQYKLYALSIDGSRSVVVGPDLPIYEANLNAIGTHIAFVSETMKTAPEAYISALSAKEAKRVSNQNEMFADYVMPETDKIRWKSKDGLEIEGLLTYPIGYESGKKYPLLLIVHGGPMVMFSENYLGKIPFPYPLAAFAQEGYAILRPNPRGSGGYGRSFRYANYEDWGGGDFEDIMSGVDHVIKMGVADPDKLGVMGWSYGGYMTAWAVTQTNRFKAASMGAGLSNLISMAGTSDLHRFMKDYFRGDIWDKLRLYTDRSPVTHAGNVKTPVLIQHGENDERVPISQGMEFFYALQRQGKPVTFSVYPRGSHRPGEPKHMLHVLQENLNWFKERL